MNVPEVFQPAILRGGDSGLPQVLGSPRQAGLFRSVFDLGERVAWIVRLVKIGAEGEGRTLDVMGIDRPDDLGDIADLGLTLDETKRLLAGSNRRSSPPR